MRVILTKNNLNLLVFIALLAGLFAQIPAQMLGQGWTLWKGYQNIANVVVSNWQGNYAYTPTNTLNVGKVGYIGITLPNVISGSYIIFSGYDLEGAAPIFKGNITGYYLDNTYLLSNITQNNQPYNMITAYYNPTLACTSSNCAATIGYNNYFSNSFFNGYQTCSNPMETITIYKSAGFTDSCTAISLNQYTGYIDVPFSTWIPYVIKSSNRSNTNVSLTYSSQLGGSYSYALNITGFKDNLINYDFISQQNVNSVSANTPSIFLNPSINSQYQLLSNGIGLYGVSNTPNGAIFNTTNTLYHLFGVFFTQGFDLKLFYGNLISAGLVPKVNYFMFPAYTTNYTLTSNNVANVVSPNEINPLNCTGSNGWYCGFLYRIPIANLTWQFRFNSAAYFTDNDFNTLGSGYTIGINNVGFTLITLPRYSGMSCSGVYLRAWDNTTKEDYGTVPYTILNCTPSIMQIVIPSITLSSYPFTSLYAYFDSPNGLSGFSNSVILNNFQPITNKSQFTYGGYGYPNNLPFLLTLSDPININSVITAYPTFKFGTHANTHEYFNIGYPNNIEVNTLVINDRFLTWLNPSDNYYQFIGSTLDMLSGGASPTSIIANTTKHIATEQQDGMTFTFNGIYLNASINKLYSTDYVLGSPEMQTNPITPTPITPTPIPHSNSSIGLGKLMSNGTFGLGNYNSIMNGLGLNIIIDWNGFDVPKFVVALIVIIVSIIVLAISENAYEMIIGLIMLWIAGILQIELIPIAVIVSIIFAVHIAVSHHK